MENSNSDWHVIVTIYINKHIAFWFYWYGPFHILRCEMTTWGNHRLVCFEDFFWSFLFLSLARIKQCLPPSTEVSLTMVISFTILEQSRVIHSVVVAGQAGRVRCIVICITCNQPHIFVDCTLKSQALQFACWAPFAIKWTAIAFSSDRSKFLHSWLSFWQTQTLSKVKTFSAEFT